MKKSWPKIFSLLRAPVLIVVIPFFTLFCSLVTVLILVPFTSRKVCDGFISFWAKTLCFISGIHVRVRGLENLNRETKANPSTPFILVSNHLGLFDIPVLYSVIPLSFRMAAKAELFKIPIFGLALRLAGFFPVVRENTDGSKAHLHKVLRRFKKGESFWMAPEGTRFDGVGVGEFKLGAFFLAQKAGVKILPISLYGTQYVLPKHSLIVNRGRISQDVLVDILPSVNSWALDSNDDSFTRHSLRDHVRSQIVEAFFQAHRSNEGLRPESLE